MEQNPNEVPKWALKEAIDCARVIDRQESEKQRGLEDRIQELQRENLLLQRAQENAQQVNSAVT